MIGSFRFSRFQDQMLLTNDAGYYAFLSEEEFHSFISESMDKTSDTWNMLEDRLFCSVESKESYLQYAINSVRDNHAYLFSATSLFIFVLTNQCNNRCIYCQAEGCSVESKMSPDTAIKAIERICETPSRNLTIEFQGGEPLLNWEAIKAIVEYSKTALADRNINFALVSNLALLTEEMADYIATNNISVSTSLDGPMELHDLNRPKADGRGSFESMLHGINILRAHGIEVGAIQTTTRSSLTQAKEIVETYASLGFKSLFLRPLTRLGAASRCWNEIGYSADEFIHFYQDGLAAILELNKQGIPLSESHASIFLSKILNGRSPNYMELRSPCGASIGQVAFTPNGDVYTCDEGRMLAEMGDNSFRLGNVYENGYNDWMNCSVCKAVCSASLLETLPGCCDCVYQPYCGVCPIINYALEGSLTPSVPNNDRCRIYRGMLDSLFSYLLTNDDRIIGFFNEWIKE